MLYDEEGRAYVEPPLLPENQQVRYIVKDYHRMMIDHDKLQRKNKELRETISNLNGKQYAQFRIILEQYKHISKLIKMAEKKINVPVDIKIYHEQICRMLTYYNTKNK